jgi:hypothetical protein
MLEDHSLGETAAQIGISVSATKGRVFHAKAALRKSKMLRKIQRSSGNQRLTIESEPYSYRQEKEEWLRNPRRRTRS